MNLEPSHWIILAVIGAWVVVMLSGARQAHEKERMKHLERLAMIEKGLAPPPEPAPSADMLRTLMATAGATQQEKDVRTLTALRFLGVMAIAGGIGIWFMLMVLGQWDGAVAIGGMLAIIGSALIVTTMRALRIRKDGD